MLFSYARGGKKSVSQALSGLLLRLQEAQRLNLPYELVGTLRVIVSNFENTQTLAIPPRILSIITFQFEELLDIFVRHCRDISRFSRRVGASHIYGRSRERQEILVGSRAAIEPNFYEAVRECGLEELQKKFGFDQVPNFSLFLTLVQYAAKSLIHLFTAARHSEILELRHGCLGKMRVRGMEIPTVTGAPAKKDNVFPVVWVTSDLGVKAAKVARILSKMIYRAQGVKTSEASFLFISVTYSPFSNKRPKGKFPQLSGRLDSGLGRHLNPVEFKQSDYDDLRYLLPLGEVDNHPGLIVGEPWKLSSHQFRRSFGIYATASGLARFPALKSQYHHFKVTTSIAYGEGGGAKVEFGGDGGGDHIRLKYDEESLAMDACLYVQEVLFSSEKLYGPKGRYIEKVVKPTLGENIRLIYKETAASVKKGTMAYAQTILGGCMTTEPCMKKAHGSVVVCTDCAKGVIKKSKLISVIDEQRELVLTLSPDSVEFRTEQQQLEELESFLAKIQESEADDE
ncbi:hypothetical protein [Pseudomonas sp. PB3P13]